MHIETSDLVYKELEQKVYLTPWAKLQRRTTTIQCQNAVVLLQDQRLHQVDGEHAFGHDDREDRQTAYSADHMKALFNEDGVLVNIIGDHNAKVVSSQPAATTTLVGDRADMRFAVETKTLNGAEKQDSNLHLVLADGHAVAESQPKPQGGVELADTRTLRSDHIELEMKPDGKDLQEIRTSSQSQVEFKPNRPTSQHQDRRGISSARSIWRGQLRRHVSSVERGHENRPSAESGDSGNTGQASRAGSDVERRTSGEVSAEQQQRGHD